ncbi:MAG TPA: VOC family protein [Candidatus Binatia bacterium]|nr:VOC family protein [Candidatus Binatia bacterium]
MTPRSVSHIALCIRDFDRSLHFYRDLLGLQVAQEGTDTEVSQYQQGIYERENRKFRFATLRYGKENTAPYGMSEDAPVIVLIAPVDASPTGTSIKVDQIGISHLGFWVKGLDAVYEDLKSKGVTFVAPPHVLGKTKAGTIRSAFAQDPDGILIQIDEMVPAK